MSVRAVERIGSIPRRLPRGARVLVAAALGGLVVASLPTGGSAAPPPKPGSVGQWELLPYESPVLPIHAALLRTGRVWLGAGSSNDPDEFAAGSFRTATWDPVAGTFNTDIRTPWDLFCAGHSFLADGRLFITGGTIGYPTEEAFFKGSPEAYTFDPVVEHYRRQPDMAVGRWYPTQVTLGDGRVYVIAGIDQTGLADAVVPEIFDPSSATWTELPETAVWPLYPALFLTAERGTLFYSGAHVFANKDIAAPGFLDIPTSALTPVPGLFEPDQRDQAASVLLPPAQDQRVMVIGGGSPPPPVGVGVGIANVDVIDLKVASPQYTAAAPMAFPRMHVSAVLLPDRTVLATGGGQVREDQPVYAAEIYDPMADDWRTVASASVARLYHSFALLLPDARVLVGGSNPGDFMEHRLEIYSPPYLFRGGRPQIEFAPGEARYGEAIRIETSQATRIASVSLVRPSATTHSRDTEQRLVDVPFSRTGSSLELLVPGDPLVAPPGWYMLFVVNDRGVPSEAAWIRLG